MVKRERRPSFRHFFFVAFALMVMMACWDANRTNAAVVTPTIPKESIRLRILANSDAPQDQALKREIRDAIVARMQDWVTGPHTIEEARAVVQAHLPEFDELVGRMIAERGYRYSHTVELGVVPFPTKMYGDEVYPAGDYEALRVIIGEGQGQNWWCVLFPPLCFVDSVSGEAVAAEPAASKAEGQGKSQSASAKASGTDKAAHADGGKAGAAGKAKADQADASGDGAASGNDKPEVRFFLWDMLQKVIGWFS
ncbi:stage II sporulation protein R [Paenibacillus athensensis]|uniref:Stage II sporulation protein R n=1 Tax=Paenibacillus athensensis TaxID=1967502 RepID=A0A4Y8Q536_9BACL|nr:stage II sporulation protein R [Paenibacillus athensensis]MCD1260909.1 stage II sporulation protein R [Paenibacillus athensensis]